MSDFSLDKIKDEVLESFDKKVEKLANEAAAKLESSLKSVMADSGLPGSGNNIKAEVTKRAWEYLIKVSDKNTAGAAKSLNPVYKPVEHVSSRITKKKNAYSGFHGDADSVKERASYSMAKGIERKGTDAVKFFDIALRQGLPEIIRALSI